MDDAGEVALGLTEAQKNALRGLTAKWGLAPFDGWRRCGQVCTNLSHMGLVEKEPAGTRFLGAPGYRLTPLGLRVRQYLETNP